jgi:hypothetical protein
VHVQSEAQSMNRVSLRHALNTLSVLDELPGPLVVRGASGAVELDQGLGAFLLELGLESEVVRHLSCIVVPMESLERWHQSQSHRRGMWSRVKNFFGL